MSTEEPVVRKNEKGIRKYLPLIVSMFALVGCIAGALGWMDDQYIRAETYEVQSGVVLDKISGVENDVLWIKFLLLSERVGKLEIAANNSGNIDIMGELGKMRVELRMLEQLLGLK
ncbi:hypothetical protein CMI37_34140 [Candidatus Pacearchaeota archaeon]|nr:hypothetical protein [Candidatus Pacearchaeota archaeon]|tara:strand:+ start:1405 stop:1752 length:348 start_codon:yes stop_codon:yes gene_type:complete